MPFSPPPAWGAGAEPLPYRGGNKGWGTVEVAEGPEGRTETYVPPLQLLEPHCDPRGWVSVGEAQQPGNRKGSTFLFHPPVWAPNGCAAEVSLPLKGLVLSCMTAASP